MGLVGVNRSALWSELTVDHVAALFGLERLTLARNRCEEYLRDAETWEGGMAAGLSLRLLRAEIGSSIGDRSGVDADLGIIRALLDGQADGLTAAEHAAFQRLEGLSAAAHGFHDKAEHHLREAARIYRAIGNQPGVDAIRQDQHRFAVQHGEETAVSAELKGPQPESVAALLLRARALRREQRYEEAIEVLKDARPEDLDPALRFPVIFELVVLLRTIADHSGADRLLPSLKEAAESSADPSAAREAVSRISGTDVPVGDVATTCGQTLQRARWLIYHRRARQAERLLIELRSRAKLDDEVAVWHLAAGELELLRGDPREAIPHLHRAVQYAVPAWLVEVRVHALRQLGHAFYRLGDWGVEPWTEAHRLEREIAKRQPSPDVQIRMLHAVPDEHDELIRATAAALQQHGPDRAAAVVVAMEAARGAELLRMDAARGAELLRRVLPRRNALARDLPNPSDHTGAWQWVRRMTEVLPGSQVVWLLHSTPDQVHHAAIGRGLLHHASVDCGRDALTKAIDDLKSCWERPESLEASMRLGDFDHLLAEIAALIDIDAVIPKLPPHVLRIAIVAGGALSDLPFTAMRLPGASEPLGLRYALSDLPCLSAQRPLKRRSRRLRGDRRLLVSPRAAKLAIATPARARSVLEGDQATAAALASALRRHRYRQVRIDSHGQHGDAPERSWLQLAPDTPEGRLDVEALKSMELNGCGTLVLGACESGMAQRIGREERIGFVSAALHAGAAAVVAARWVAEDAAAAIVLDSFDRYVRYFPRDVALQRALLDVGNRMSDTQEGAPPAAHPALWACWTLYGDSGFQTRVGLVRRWLRRSVDERKGARRWPV